MAYKEEGALIKYTDIYHWNIIAKPLAIIKWNDITEWNDCLITEWMNQDFSECTYMAFRGKLYGISIAGRFDIIARLIRILLHEEQEQVKLDFITRRAGGA